MTPGSTPEVLWQRLRPGLGRAPRSFVSPLGCQGSALQLRGNRGILGHPLGFAALPPFLLLLRRADLRPHPGTIQDTQQS